MERRINNLKDFSSFNGKEVEIFTKNGQLICKGILFSEIEPGVFCIGDTNGKKYLITDKLLEERELKLREK